MNTINKSKPLSFISSLLAGYLGRQRGTKNRFESRLICQNLRLTGVSVFRIGLIFIQFRGVSNGEVSPSH